MKNTCIAQFGLILLLAVLAISVTLYSPKLAKSDQVKENEKIAIVNGKDILLKDIQVSLDQVKDTLRSRNGGAPVDKDKSALLEIQKNVETHNLYLKIDTIITDQQIKRFQITVSDKDLHEMWQKYAPAFKKLTVETKKDLVLLSEVLNEVYEEGKDPNKVYEEILSSTTTSKESWKASLYYYKSPKRRTELKAQLKKENIVMSEDGANFKDTVTHIKLDKEIDKRLQKADPEFAYFKKILPNYYVPWDMPEKGLSGEKSDAFTYIRYAREEWWHELYQRSNITILDKKYQEALDTLLADPPKLAKQQLKQLKRDYDSQIQQPKTDVQPTPGTPPKMPVFDAQEVRQLTNTIEEPQHAMLLKIGYFYRHIE